MLIFYITFFLGSLFNLYFFYLTYLWIEFYVRFNATPMEFREEKRQYIANPECKCHGKNLPIRRSPIYANYLAQILYCT